jgi:hypothetical protein
MVKNIPEYINWKNESIINTSNILAVDKQWVDEDKVYIVITYQHHHDDSGFTLSGNKEETDQLFDLLKDVLLSKNKSNYPRCFEEQ